MIRIAGIARNCDATARGILQSACTFGSGCFNCAYAASRQCPPTRRTFRFRFPVEIDIAPHPSRRPRSPTLDPCAVFNRPWWRRLSVLVLHPCLVALILRDPTIEPGPAFQYVIAQTFACRRLVAFEAVDSSLGNDVGGLLKLNHHVVQSLDVPINQICENQSLLLCLIAVDEIGPSRLHALSEPR